MRLEGLSWPGGKTRAVGHWIADQLPAGRCYVEPFAGMLGVLCKRARSSVEVINDLDGEVTNWWRVVRDHPDALADLLRFTPDSERLFDDLMSADLGGWSDIALAWRFTVIVQSSFGRMQKSFGKRWDTQTQNRVAYVAERLEALADRLRDVVIYEMCAVEFLERWSLSPTAVIYVDPPYRSASVGYDVREPDWDRLTEALLACRGAVAISGYEGEWDVLGWRQETFDSHTTIGQTNDTVREYLWLNYPPAQERLI